MTDARILLDTGPLVALLAENDAYHRRCVETLAALSPPLLTCWPVLTEAAWILRRYPRPADRLNDAHAAGLFDILPLNADEPPVIAAVSPEPRVGKICAHTTPLDVIPCMEYTRRRGWKERAQWNGMYSSMTISPHGSPAWRPICGMR